MRCGISILEDTLYGQMRMSKLPIPIREYRFSPPRRWRLDFAWPELRLAVEVEGGIWMGKSGHNTGAGISRDIVKSNALAMEGWMLLRVTAGAIESGEALKMIKEAMIRFQRAAL